MQTGLYLLRQLNDQAISIGRVGFVAIVLPVAQQFGDLRGGHPGPRIFYGYRHFPVRRGCGNLDLAGLGILYGIIHKVAQNDRQ
jgi:hypothetical protein